MRRSCLLFVFILCELVLISRSCKMVLILGEWCRWCHLHSVAVKSSDTNGKTRLKFIIHCQDGQDGV